MAHDSEADTDDSLAKPVGSAAGPAAGSSAESSAALSPRTTSVSEIPGQPLPPSQDSLGEDTALLRNGFLFVVTIGVLASAALAVDYTHAVPVFCDEVKSGCGAVKQSSYAAFWGVPTPIVGLLGFAFLVCTALLRGALARVLFLATGLAFASAGALFLFTQYRLGEFCKYCVLVDVSSILVFGVALHRYLRQWDWPQPWKWRIALGCIPLMAGALVLVIGHRMQGGLLKEVPEPVARALASVAPSKTLVLDFVDYECPFCRRMHENLKPLLDAHPGKFQMVRKHVPLQMHPFARAAARAAICAEKLGKGDEYSELLLVQPENDLIDFALEKLARKVGLSEQGFRDCLKDPATEARIESDKADYKACEGKGLPMIFLGRERLFGLMEPEALKPLVEAALVH